MSGLRGCRLIRGAVRADCLTLGGRFDRLGRIQGVLGLDQIRSLLGLNILEEDAVFAAFENRREIIGALLHP